ncbi:protein DGS1, mitochondrial [Impatiens glandulifera]|uniref:protein DGS1, mitochondrial n=1 Tax=Impatiens glandulifera TaxID=253017 RepID=UPI001FB07EE0|nr:protein DGS1, mitochondrial [Impatiens glandulifera]
MASPPADQSTGVGALFSTYSNQLWSRLATLLPSSTPKFLGIFNNPNRQTSPARYRSRRTSLPLPLPYPSLGCSFEASKFSKVFEALEDILEIVFLNLHNIQKNLQFWQSKAEGSNAQKKYFMIFERGPKAFVHETYQLLHDVIVENSSTQSLSQSASTHISVRISILTSLRYHLATFLAQFYMEIDRFGEAFVEDDEKSLLSLFVALDGLFSQLEASISLLPVTSQGGISSDGSFSIPLTFGKLSEVNHEGSQWTECEIKDIVTRIYENLNKLDSHLSGIVAKHRKPKKVTLYWMHYTCGAIGVSLCSIWLLRHSSIMGSPDIDNWIHEAKDSTMVFWTEHVEQPLSAIRDELFETFRKRHEGEMELEEVQLTANSLHRMLLAFGEQTKGQKLPENASDQEMMEIVMARYEKELMHPIQSLVGGELARALLIQIQKLKLDTETAMLELNQILRANEINFAILAALPAFFLSVGLLMLVRAWLKQDTRAEGQGRIARIQRRLLIVEVEKRIMHFQICVDRRMEKDAEYMYGLVLYSLDRLYHAVERHAKAAGEWPCLRQDIVDLAKPGLKTEHKFIITSRLERVYDCLLPSSKRS